jgi:hypothetical protein
MASEAIALPLQVEKKYEMDCEPREMAFEKLPKEIIEQ